MLTARGRERIVFTLPPGNTFTGSLGCTRRQVGSKWGKGNKSSGMDHSELGGLGGARTPGALIRTDREDRNKCSKSSLREESFTDKF